MLVKIWDIQLLGGLAARRNAIEIHRFPTRKTAELLAYLAFHRRKIHEREAIVGVLWPNADLEQGRNRLKQALSSLRRQLEPPGTAAKGIFVATRSSLNINAAAIETDVAQFQAATKSAARAQRVEDKDRLLTNALEYYSGPLYPECNSDWVIRERAILEDELLAAALQHANVLIESGDLTRAIYWAQVAAEVSPIHEGAHHTLMDLLIKANRRTDALDQYRRLDAALRRRFGVAPRPETQALVQSIPGFESGRTGDAISSRREATPSPVRGALKHPDSGSTVDNEVRDSTNPYSSRQVAGVLIRLPTARDPMFGRERELDLLTSILCGDPATHAPIIQSSTANDAPHEPEARCNQERLLTISGPPGCGKSRLALAVAAQIAPFYRGRVLFLTLAEITDSDVILREIARNFGEESREGSHSCEQIAELIGAEPAVVFLDGFEHSTAHAATVVRLLETTPALKVVITSSVHLAAEGQYVLPLRPLPVPEVHTRAESLPKFDSVRTFVHYAQMCKPDFQVTERNASAVGEICRRLDGLPLALQLAGGRAASHSPRHMLEQMARGLSWISRSGAANDTHIDLESVMRQAIRRLPAQQQNFVALLAAIPGDFDVAAAADICEHAQAELDLQILYRHSLLERSSVNGRDRYTMLGLYRRHLLDNVSDSAQQTLSRRFAEYYCRFAELECARLNGPHQSGARGNLSTEHGNIVHALTWHLESEENHVSVVRMAGRLSKYWLLDGLIATGIHWLETAIRLNPRGSAREIGTAKLGLAKLLRRSGSFAAAIRHAETALENFEQCDDFEGRLEAATFLAANSTLLDNDSARTFILNQNMVIDSRRIGNVNGLAEALKTLGMTAWSNRKPEQAQELLEEASLLLRQHGDPHGLTRILSESGYVALWAGDYQIAHDRFSEMLSLAEATGISGDMSHALWHLGNLERCRANYEDSLAYLQRSLTARQAEGNPEAIADSLSSLGMTYACRGDFERACMLQEHSLTIRRTLGAAVDAAFSIDRLGWVYLHRNNNVKARELFGESLTVFRSARNHLGMCNSLDGLGYVVLRTGKAPSAHQLFHESMRLRQASGDKRGILDSLEALGQCALAQRIFRRSTILFSAAEVNRKRLAIPAHPSDRTAVEHAVTVLRTALNHEEYESQRREGEHLTLSEAVNLALE